MLPRLRPFSRSHGLVASKLLLRYASCHVSGTVIAAELALWAVIYSLARGANLVADRRDELQRIRLPRIQALSGQKWIAC